MVWNLNIEDSHSYVLVVMQDLQVCPALLRGMWHENHLSKLGNNAHLQFTFMPCSFNNRQSLGTDADVCLISHDFTLKTQLCVIWKDWLVLATLILQASLLFSSPKNRQTNFQFGIADTEPQVERWPFICVSYRCSNTFVLLLVTGLEKTVRNYNKLIPDSLHRCTVCMCVVTPSSHSLRMTPEISMTPKTQSSTTKHRLSIWGLLRRTMSSVYLKTAPSLKVTLWTLHLRRTQGHCQWSQALWGHGSQLNESLKTGAKEQCEQQSIKQGKHATRALRFSRFFILSGSSLKLDTQDVFFLFVLGTSPSAFHAVLKTWINKLKDTDCCVHSVSLRARNQILHNVFDYSVLRGCSQA